MWKVKKIKVILSVAAAVVIPVFLSGCFYSGPDLSYSPFDIEGIWECREMEIRFQSSGLSVCYPGEITLHGTTKEAEITFWTPVNLPTELQIQFTADEGELIEYNFVSCDFEEGYFTAESDDKTETLTGYDVLTFDLTEEIEINWEDSPRETEGTWICQETEMRFESTEEGIRGTATVNGKSVEIKVTFMKKGYMKISYLEVEKNEYGNDVYDVYMDKRYHCDFQDGYFTAELDKEYLTAESASEEEQTKVPDTLTFVLEG